MVRRSTAPAENAPDVTDTAPQDMPGVPAGVEADVNIRYKARVEAKPSPPRDLVDESDELNRLALAHNNPPDPLSEFLETWADYAGYNCMVLRLPDPSTRRPPMGQPYNRSHLSQPEQLGAMTFDPNPINFISALQFINGNSGGCFQIWLTNNAGGRVEGAVLYSIAIADPPKTTADRGPMTADERLTVSRLQERPKSDSERKLEEAKDRLFNTALDRALNPAPLAAANGNGLSAEDNAKLFLLGSTNFLDGIFGNMAELAKKAANVSEPSAPTIKDRALDAAVNLITTNPAIVDRLSGVVERIVARVLPDPRYDTPLQYTPAPPYAPAPPPQTPNSELRTPNAITDLPETPDEDDEPGNEDDDIVDILDQLTTLLNSNDPLSLDPPPPVIVQLMKDYPIKARAALKLIAAMPLEDIVEWIKDNGGPLYVSLLDGPASGPFLRQRLAEFKLVCEQARDKVKTKEQAKDASGGSPENPTSTSPAVPNPS